MEVNNKNFPYFTKRMNYIKHTEGGNQKMCKVMEDYAREQTVGSVREMLLDGLV